MIEALLKRGEPFFIASQHAARQRIKLWAYELGSAGVKPYYAVKCNPDRHLLRVASTGGWGFDCASPLEVEAVRKESYDADIIYANPCKSPAAIMAVRGSCRATTFDSEEELEKLEGDAWDGRLVLRLKVDDSGSLQPFGSKFGCRREDIGGIMRTVRGRGVKLAGVSFHVGSHCIGEGAYRKAIEDAHSVIEDHATLFKDGRIVVDIGGGFPGNQNGLFRRHAGEIREALRATVGGRAIEYIAEPGRFLATSVYTLYVPVIGKRQREGEFQYTVDESVYSAFSGIPFDGLKVSPRIIRRRQRSSIGGGSKPATVFGRTCDSQDIIMKGQLEEMDVGDYMVFGSMGAYTLASSSEFNGFPVTKVHWSASM